ncbi:unnamed protein product [Tilletia laevis]|nr:hypothetical protein CF335_g1999 [Tilletia laevis]CAD6914798.1 unnamed protein product [Tilletia laevis]CAD7069185.1 unnamed protein product [Tilletia caries]
MFSPRSPLMRTRELILDAGWRRTSPPDCSGSERGLDEADDEAVFLQDEGTSFAFFDNCPPELAVHIFRHLSDVRDLIAVSQVCRSWYGLVRQYNGLWQAVYLQTPTWTIRPDTRIVLERHARELAAASASESARAESPTVAASVSSSSFASATADQPHEHHHHGSILWHSMMQTHEQERTTIAPLPYINLAQPPPSALCRPRGRKSWIAAHLPDLSSLTLGSGGGGGIATNSSSRASSPSSRPSWDLASSVRSRVLSGAASMAQSATEQLQRRRRQSVHADAPSTADLLESHSSQHNLPSDRRASTSLSRTVPTSPSPLRLQLAEEEGGQPKSGRAPFSLTATGSVKRPSSAIPTRSRPNMTQRALGEHERIRTSASGSFGSEVDHFDDLDWRRLCMARWELDRRWGLPLPSRRAESASRPTRIQNRTGSTGNDDAFNRPVSSYLKGHESNIYCIRMDSSFFEGAGRIVSGSKDCTVKVWNRATGRCVHTLAGHARSVLCLQYDDELLVTGSSDHTVLVWDFTCGLRERVSLVGVDGGVSHSEPTVLARLQGHEDSVLNVALNDKYIVSCGKERVVRVWDRKTGDLVRRFAEHATAVNGIALSGSLAISASGDPAFYIWDLENETLVRKVMSEQLEGLACVVAQGNTIATGSKPTIKIWDARTGECKQTLKGHGKMVRALAYDSRRALLVSGGYDCLVLCWHVPAVDHTLPQQSSNRVMGSGSDQSEFAVASLQTATAGLGLGLPMPSTEVAATAAVASERLASPSNSFASAAPRLASSSAATPRLASSSAATALASTSEMRLSSYNAIAAGSSSRDRALEHDFEPEPLAEFRDHSGRILSLAVDGTHLISASSDERICVRNFAVALPSDPFESVDLEIVGGGDALCS